MLTMLLVCCAMIGDDGGSATAGPADRAAYEAAQKKTGNDASAHVKLALWCEGARSDGRASEAPGLGGRA